jgi:elongation factor Ts
VALESEANEDDLKAMGKNLAMHIAFTKPHCVAISDVSPAVLEKEKKFLQEQIQEQSGDRPADVQVKMVEGRLRKFFETIVLEDQDYVRDSGKTVKEFLKQEGDRLGKPVRIAGFAYAKLGENSKEGHEEDQK